MQMRGEKYRRYVLALSGHDPGVVLGAVCCILLVSCTSRVFSSAATMAHAPWYLSTSILVVVYKRSGRGQYYALVDNWQHMLAGSIKVNGKYKE